MKIVTIEVNQFHKLNQLSGYVINYLCKQDENEKEKLYILPLKGGGGGVVQAVFPPMFSLLAFWDYHVYVGTPDSGPQASEALFFPAPHSLFSVLFIVGSFCCSLFQTFPLFSSFCC